MANNLYDSEVAVLGAMILHSECLILGTAELADTDFEEPDHRVIFTALVHLSGRNAFDTIELLNEAAGGDADKRAGLAVLICAAQEGAAGQGNIRTHMTRLKDRALRTGIVRACHVLLSNANNAEMKTEELLTQLNSTMETLTVRHVGMEEYDHQKSVHAFTEKIINVKTRGSLKGIPSNLPTIDKHISGWQKERLYIIGGLKKTGKSRFTLDLVSRWMTDGQSGLIFSMEMSDEQIHTCIYGTRLEINTANLGTSNLGQDDCMKIMEECNAYAKQKLWISRKSSITPGYIRQVMQMRRRRGPLGFVVVDYIQRMSSPTAKGRTEEVEHCAMALADIARDERVIMVVLSQLSGESEKQDHKNNKPVYANVKNSQTIIEAADVAIMLVDPNRGKAEVFHENFKTINAIILQRDGESDIMVPLMARLQFSKFNSQSGRTE